MLSTLQQCACRGFWKHLDKTVINHYKLMYNYRIVINIVGEGETAYYEKFHLLPQCVQNWHAAEASDSVCILAMVQPSFI